MNTDWFIFFPTLFVSLVIFGLGFNIFNKDKAKLINRIFFIYTFVVLVWMLSVITRFATDDVDLIVVSAKFSYFAATFVGYFTGFFCYYFPIPNNNKKLALALAVSSSLIALASLFTKLILSDVLVVNGVQKNILGRFYPVYIAFFALTILWGAYNLLTKKKQLSLMQKSQVNLILVGILISACLGAFTNLIIPFYFGTTTTEKFGPLAVTFLIIFIAYAIVRHRFLDIKFALRRSSVYLASLMTVILAIIALKIAAIIFFPDSILWEDFVLIIIATIIYPPVKNRYYKIANKYLFASIYDARKLIAALSDNLRSILYLDKLYDYLADTLTEAMHCKGVAILFYDINKSKYTIKYNHEFDFGKKFNLASNHELHQLFNNRNKCLTISSIMRHSDYAQFKDIISGLVEVGVDVLIPLNIKYKTIGLILLGRKESEEPYYKEDIETLEVVGAQAAVAIDNALKYEEVKNFNLNLKQEIDKATKELREANEQLKILDAAKSEFISIASHQLRTPLTVIKGYISMILEGSFGAVEKIVRDPLEKVYESNERLVELVEDLLNISRIESGRMEYRMSPYNLEKVVESVVAELAEHAKVSDLILKYANPEKLLPKVNIDAKKIREVVMNLVDNAIKYTHKTQDRDGLVEVSLTQNGDSVRFCVVDNGIGISREDMANLFKKFSRGKGVSVLNTQGTGLGLYVAKEIIKAHNGRIWAESEGLGQGTKFCFEVPTIK